MRETISDRNAASGGRALANLTTADEADQRHAICELERLIARLRLIISAQARLIGNLYAKIPDDEGAEP